ncbi:ABC transporter ATP-binding protein [Chryseolinea soli]|uniref:ATP-binding cassette domain-containing protein n=1 Tax=Chryseolinea soli TaxID=2321403 RepID=A0A385SV36_9BACT|nr:ATP-binding cassette domain-containing protein [Chryseolinea soli]AYB33570.1 ATP-binding cassette domain-containing protein [Chryseolinea soli]
MEEPWIIETRRLSYTFAKASEQTLFDINLQVPRGSVYCFVGPNGAGKTTTLRLLLGLLRSQAGSIRIFGRDFFADRRKILSQIGSFIEQPSLYEHLTGRQNLEVYRLTYGRERSRIEEVLKITDILDAGNKLVRAYSLGMKQRLSIALALLNDPEVLILDEPTNGLDPQGIVDMRVLIQELSGTYGKTILLSSHLLSEVEKVATHFGVLRGGKLQFQGTKSELMIRRSQNTVLRLETADVQKAMSALQERFETICLDETFVLVKHIAREQVPELTRHLVASGVGIYNIGLVHENFEETFFHLTT